MDSNLIIEKIHSAFEGEFNPGFIKGKGARHSDCFVYYVYGNANYIFENCTLNVSEGTGFYISKSSVYDIKINEKSKYICIDFEFQQSDRTRHSLSFGNVGLGISNLFSRFYLLRIEIICQRHSVCFMKFILSCLKKQTKNIQDTRISTQ